MFNVEVLWLSFNVNIYGYVVMLILQVMF